LIIISLSEKETCEFLGESYGGLRRKIVTQFWSATARLRDAFFSFFIARWQQKRR